MTDGNPDGTPPVDVMIDHDPDCGTFRNTLAMIRNAGSEPLVGGS